MKKIFITLLGFGLLFHCFGQEKESSFSIGMPINASMDWSSPNYSIDFMLGKKIAKNSVIYIGTNYEKVNLTPSKNLLTYDRNIFTLFGAYRYYIHIVERVKILPMIKIGYSFLKNELNETKDNTINSNGIYISEQIDLSYVINERFSIALGSAFSTVFTRIEPSSDITIPNNYIIKDDKKVPQFKIMVTCIYRFGK